MKNEMKAENELNKAGGFGDAMERTNPIPKMLPTISLNLKTFEPRGYFGTNAFTLKESDSDLLNIEENDIDDVRMNKRQDSRLNKLMNEEVDELSR